MRTVLARTLIAAGAVVGVAGALLMAAGVRIQLPPDVLNLVIYKMIFAAAFGLLIAGALVGRRGGGRVERTLPAPDDVAAARLAPPAPSFDRRAPEARTAVPRAGTTRRSHERPGA